MNIDTIFDYALAGQIRKAVAAGAPITVIPTNDFPPTEPKEDNRGRRAYFAASYTGSMRTLLNKYTKGTP